MNKKARYRLLATIMVVAFGSTGCQTSGGSADLGAILGGVMGAVIGSRSGDAAEGVLIGRAVGALAGYTIGEIHLKQLATREKVEDEMQQRGEAVPTEPVVSLEAFQVAPSSVEPGKPITVRGKYRAVGPGDAPVTGTMSFKKGDRVLGERSLTFQETGETEFSSEFTPPKTANAGTYTVEVALARGASQTEEKAATFEIASATRPIETTGSEDTSRPRHRRGGKRPIHTIGPQGDRDSNQICFPWS